MVVTTPATRTDTDLNQPIVISVGFNDGSRLVTNHKFQYRIDPRFTNIEPLNHLVVYVYGSIGNQYVKPPYIEVGRPIMIIRKTVINCWLVG